MISSLRYYLVRDEGEALDRRRLRNLMAYKYQTSYVTSQWMWGIAFGTLGIGGAIAAVGAWQLDMNRDELLQVVGGSVVLFVSFVLMAVAFGGDAKKSMLYRFMRSPNRYSVYKGFLTTVALAPGASQQSGKVLLRGGYQNERGQKLPISEHMGVQMWNHWFYDPAVDRSERKGMRLPVEVYIVADPSSTADPEVIAIVAQA